MTAMSGLNTFDPLTADPIVIGAGSGGGGAAGGGAGATAAGAAGGVPSAVASFVSSVVRRWPYCCFSASKSLRN